MILPLLIFSLLGTALMGKCGPRVLELPNQCANVKSSGAENGYFEANAVCQDLGGHLVSIHNERANALLVAYVQSVVTDTIYIGADKHRNGVLTWIDGTTMNYTNWAPGEPSGSGYCVTLNVNDNSWYTTDCQHKIPYICEIPGIGITTTGGAPSTTTTRKRRSPSTKEPITDNLSTSDTYTNGTTATTGKTPLSATTSTAEVTGASAATNTTTETTETTAITTISTTTTAATTTTTTTTEPTTPIKATTTTKRVFTQCSRGWSKFNGQCYLFYEDRVFYHSWNSARRLCKDYDGDLVSIHSKEENDFVISITTPSKCAYTFIGLEYKNMYSRHSWSDGTLFRYDNIHKNSSGTPAVIPSVFIIHPVCHPDPFKKTWGYVRPEEFLYSMVCKKGLSE